MRVTTKIAAAAAVSLSALALASTASAAAYIAPWTGDVTTSVSLNFGDNKVSDPNGAAIYVDGATSADGVGTHTWTSLTATTGQFVDTFTFELPDGKLGFSDLTIFFDPLTAITFDSVDFNGTALQLISNATTSGFYSIIPHSIVTGGPQTLTVRGTAGVNAVWNGSGTFTPVAVPEPATWALMIAGFGGAGAMLRRRRGLATA
jgi:hypothetical protein